MVFAKASPASLAVKAAAWSEPVQRYLKRCADAGNLEACYILGMVRADDETSIVERTACMPRTSADERFSSVQIRFYCLGSRSGGAALLAKAAVGGHSAESLRAATTGLRTRQS
jgi:hypothetical protein